MEIREYNIIFNKMNIKDSNGNNLITGPKFFNIINEFDPAHEDYNQYMAERKKRELSTSRKAFCKEVLDNLEDSIRNSVITRINQIADEFGTPLTVTSITQEVQMITPQILEVENTVEPEIILEPASDSAYESIQTNDIKDIKFDVALSFPGEKRNYVSDVANILRENFDNDSIFYDFDYQSQLARPNVDTLLQNIYRNNAKLIVVFLSKEYAQKEWCGLEWRAVRDIIKSKGDEQIMFVKFDDVQIEGLFSIDGYIDANTFLPKKVAEFIMERVKLLA